jgi:hypothetical protein
MKVKQILFALAVVGLIAVFFMTKPSREANAARARQFSIAVETLNDDFISNLETER